MEDPKRNGMISESLTKRDKKRQQIATRLNKLELTFRNDRDIFYRNSLHELQTKLATLQQGTNEEYVSKKIQMEEVRDYELTKLRLWEEYQVKRIETEYNEDIAKAKENHDKMIKLIKEKLYDKLEKQIKQLKEDKILLNLVNGNSWNNSDESSAQTSAYDVAAAAAGFTTVSDRRSLRKREITSRFTTGEADDLSDGGGASSATGANTNGGYTSSGKRRRLYATRYSSNDEMSSSIASASTAIPFKSSNANNNGGVSSGYESNLSDKDYDALNSLIMENEDGGVSLILLDKTGPGGGTSNKPQTRGSNKQFIGPQGLKPEELNEDLTLLRNAILSHQDIASSKDAPFQYGCQVPQTDKPRANATLVVLARNSELAGVVKSMQSLERHFNQWFGYPWVFLNDEEFDEEFKETVKEYTSASVEFGRIGPKEWDLVGDHAEIDEYINNQGDRRVLYGNSISYHKMCRFYSGFFYRHELVTKRDWYWRVEPDVEFYCDITYDPFIEMEKRGKKYGFAVLIKELYYTVPGLFGETKAHIKKNNIKLKSAWDLFIINSKYTTGTQSQYKYDNLKTRSEILETIEDNIVLQKWLDTPDKTDADFSSFNNDLISKLIAESTQLPQLHEDRIDQEEYNLCHFWSNFEIARTDLFTSTEYQQYFEYLDSTGGFYKERWGDAPIHSLAVGMMLDVSEIHYFRDMGYRHSVLAHCPRNSPANQLEYVQSEKYKGGDPEADKYWLRPDRPGANGVGCRCRCPKRIPDLEDNPDACIKKWKRVSEDNYRAFKTVDVDEYEKKIRKRVDTYLAKGGVLGKKRVTTHMFWGKELSIL
ncbi:KTR5 [[Candida] subhashii]|uniref:KTR5 n=1 Tax=[Candida] subhashii TaxID=561895 RepID=A0A8J5UXP7_9ASCO|nr:KTR5 [[Candida] subhashii]KAG7663755.1 KTR5 [[Candida] subhashii]